MECQRGGGGEWRLRTVTQKIYYRQKGAYLVFVWLTLVNNFPKADDATYEYDGCEGCHSNCRLMVWGGRRAVPFSLLSVACVFLHPSMCPSPWLPGEVCKLHRHLAGAMVLCWVLLGLFPRVGLEGMRPSLPSALLEPVPTVVTCPLQQLLQLKPEQDHANPVIWSCWVCAMSTSNDKKMCLLGYS